ncbi:exonuclease mut-7 homolog isoform X5 [Globicephala melas]|uniref:exonuclease mut-7 homolog isoform X5 n=1 Tax=Globicephala melas TaxID=9731 RepID=UPI00293D21C5|nr:exonuclease mut-7 homolog isoform X5 [Globicephala melas]
METPPPPRAVLDGGPQALWEPQPPAGALQTPERCVWPCLSILEGDSCPQGLFEAISGPPWAGPQQVLGQGSRSDLNHWSGQGVAGWPCTGPCWSRRGRPAALETVLREEAQRGFAALEDPLAALLDMLDSSRGWRGKGPSLEAWVTRELKRCLQAQLCPGPARGSPGLKQLQARAVKLLAESPPGLIEPLVSIFQLQDADRSPLLAQVHRLHQEGKFKEAIVLGAKLRLQADLDVEKMCLPLLLQDKADLVERYVDGFPDLQRRLLALMDSWCQPGFDIRVVARPVSQRHHPAAPGRPAVSVLQETGREKRISGELGRACAGPGRAGPVATGAAAAAADISRQHGPGRPVCPGPPAARGATPGLGGRRAPPTQDPGEPGQVVGMDLEWRPSFGAGGRPRASLMQVAVEGRVFLLDLPRLSSPAGGQAPQAFFRLVSRLLADPSITKLGYGLAGDLRSLGASCPALAQAEKQLRGSVDLLQVHRQMRAADRPAPGADGAAGPRGLSLLVQQVLGKPLDKAQQLSNWDRRPLCEGQLVYAAADAYCLLEVYWALCREPARFRLSGDLARSLRLGRGERAGPGELPPLQKASTSPQQVPAGEDAAPEVPARAFRVVCDSMLQGLARRLRCLGIDVLVLATGEDHRRAAEVARQEGRVILTSGLPYHKLRAQVGAGRCLSVDCSLKARQQATAVIRHFNVRVTHSDIFSRCQACNCHQYLKVSKDVMKQLVWLSGHPEGPSGTGDEAAQIEDERETGSAPEEAPGGCTYEPSCRWLEEEDLQSRVPATLGDGTRLQLSGVPAGVLRRPGLRHFYCCTGCGKVFWEGSHLGRVAENFREVLEGVPGSREPSRAPSPASSPS